MLLKDPRVDVTLDDEDGCTPLWYASCNERHEVVEWLIASGRDLGDVKNKKAKYVDDGIYYSAIEIAKERNMTEVVSVLESFIANPTQTRHEVRVKLGVLNELAAEVIALISLCAMNFFNSSQLSTITPTTETATRFFVIAKRLPMELQMVLCRRAVGSMKQNILHQDSEAAFKSLARTLLSQLQ